MRKILVVGLTSLEWSMQFLLLASTLQAQQAPAKQEVISAFEKCASIAQEKQFNNSIVKEVYKVSPSPPDALRFSSGVVTVPATASRVNGTRPECTGGSSSDLAKQIAKATSGGAVVIDLATGAGGLVAIVGGAIAAIIPSIDPHQDFANCALVCTSIPAVSSGISKDASLKYAMQDTETGPHWQPREPNEWMFWSNFDAPYFESAPKVKLHSTLNESLESCPVTIACSRFRNWAHEKNRPATIEVDLPTSAVKPSCIDYRFLNSKRFEDLFYQELIKMGNGHPENSPALIYYRNLATTQTCDGKKAH